MEIIKKVILETINNTLNLNKTELSSDEKLISSGLIDSMSFFTMVQELGTKLNIDFSVDDLTEENFDTLNNINSLIESKKAA